MAHLIEPAASGRARCRGCNRAIAKGTLRFGERLDNPYADGDMTIWYHLPCAAYRRPEPFLETLAEEVPGEALALEPIARLSRDHRRLCRLARVERAPSARARCRQCRKLIDKQSLRIPLVFHEEGMFNASGFVHLACAPAYFGTSRLLDCVRHFTPGLDHADLQEVREVLD